MEAEAGTEREERLARRFKAERTRLGLTRRRVADQCGVTENTVFNWEKAGVKIPLVALDRLMSLGFNPIDVLVPMEGEQGVGVMDASGLSKSTVLIPLHVVREVGLQPSDLFVHWSASGEAVGDLPPLAPGLFRSLLDDAVMIKGEQGVFLIRGRRKGRPFACQIRPVGARRVETRAGNERIVVTPSALWNACVPLGKLIRVMGLPWPGKVQAVSYSELLRHSLGRGERK